MLKTIVIVVICAGLLGGLATLAWYASQKPITTETVSTVTSYSGPPRLIVALLDDTGSYPYFWRAQQKILALTRGLGPNDILYVILITGRANEVEDIVVKPNPALLAQVQNISSNQLYRPELGIYREDLVRQVEGLEFRGVRNTDVYGAFFHASVAFEGEDEREKYLIICSDLGDTVDRTELIAKINLYRVKVQCLYFPTELIEAENRKYRPDSKFWIREMLGWKAESVSVFNHIESDKTKLCE